MNRFVVECHPSTGTDITVVKSGWKGWAQLELFYYALGLGYDISFERSTCPETSSVDLTVSQDASEGERSVVYMAQINGQEEIPDSFVAFIESMVNEWYWIFQNLENPESPVENEEC